MGCGAGLGGFYLLVYCGAISTAAVVAGGAGGAIGTWGTRQVAKELVYLKNEEGENPSWRQTAAKVNLVLFSSLAIAGIGAAILGFGGVAFISTLFIPELGILSGTLLEIALLAAMIGSGYFGSKNFLWAIAPLL